MALKTITFYNEKGNVSANARNAIKEQAKARTLYALAQDEMLNTARANADGGISVPLCVTEKGETVYAHLALTISTKSPDVKTTKKTAKKAEPTTPDVDLFD